MRRFLNQHQALLSGFVAVLARRRQLERMPLLQVKEPYEVELKVRYVMVDRLKIFAIEAHASGFKSRSRSSKFGTLYRVCLFVFGFC